jgi:hypothetical protein
MTLRYLDALKAIGASPSTKWIIPSEFTALVRPVTENIERALGGGEEPAGS